MFNKPLVMHATTPDGRYHRQVLLKELGAAGQAKLAGARVLVVGAGGLGCPALQYLAAAGIGCLGILDFDVVEASNLHRQILYTEEDIGRLKAEVAAARIKALNPAGQVEVFTIRLETSNALEILARFDLVIDGSDNFPTRYLVNDACVLLDKPLVYGSIFRFEGQVSVFNWPVNGIKTNYRDLFPTPPEPGTVDNCSEAGVIGVLPGIIGSMQANEAIKLITGMGVSLANRLLTYNALNCAVYELEIIPAQHTTTLAPKTASAFKNMNYDWFCQDSEDHYTELSGADFNRFLLEKAPLVIDVRNVWEQPKPTEFDYIQIPLAELESRLSQLKTEQPIVVFCQTGVRSITAANLIAHRLGHSFVYNLKGGITQWKSNQ